MALNSGILTNDGEVFILCLSSILLAVKRIAFIFFKIFACDPPYYSLPLKNCRIKLYVLHVTALAVTIHCTRCLADFDPKTKVGHLVLKVIAKLFIMHNINNKYVRNYCVCRVIIIFVRKPIDVKVM